MATPQVNDLVLRSPAGSNEVITFSWPLQVGSGQDRHDNGIDIIDTIKFVCDELPSISSAFEEINLHKIDTACYKTMTNLVDRFNKAVDSIVALEKGTSLPAERLNKFAHPSLLRHILQLVYNAAVLDPDKLNQYEPFSPEVYGETSYEFVQQMIKHVHVTNEDTFIDLGSGVGQVVLQMAGSFPLKTCLGIEKADTPSHYAERMDVYFRQFMAWFGKRYCEYKLIKGDFLMDEHREKITSSSLVFVNNFAFGPNVDHQLKERFADMRDGARVVSSKSFCPLNFRITDRNLSDIGTIMHVSEIPPLKGSVSWTCKPVAYYLHIIDRTILERYFQRLKIQKGADNDHHIGGSTRTTRDRAKREAHANHNHHHNNHHQHQQQRSANSTNITATTVANSNNVGSIHLINSSNATNNLMTSSLSLSSSSSSSSTNLITESTTSTVSVTSVKLSGDQQQQTQENLIKSRQQQRGSNDSTTTDSDIEGNGVLANDRTSNGDSGGSITQKVWSDWEILRYRNMASEDEVDNNNGVRAYFVNGGNDMINGSNNSNILTNEDGSGRTTLPSNTVNNIVIAERKRKLTRKTANVNKQNLKKGLTSNNVTTKVQRNNGSSASTTSLIITPKRAGTTAALQKRDNTNNDSNATTNNTTGIGAGRGRKGRIRKGTRGRKSLKIVGLDALHKQTLLSTSVERLSKKQPTAPGCVDQQLTSLLTDNMAHAELEIPAAPQVTPYALQILLDVFRSQYMAMIEQMKSKAFVPSIKNQIQLEEERKNRIRSRASQLDKQIKVLIDDSVALLKIRMNELGISVSSPNDLIAKAKEIVGRHKELQSIAKKIQIQVHTSELEQQVLIRRNIQILPEFKNSHFELKAEKVFKSNENEMPMDLFKDTNESSLINVNSTENLELSVKFAHDVVLKEIAKTLVQRQRLVEQVNTIEREAEMLEQTVENKNLTTALIAHQRHNIQHEQQYQPLSLTTDNMRTTAMNYKLSAIQSTSVNNNFKSSVNTATAFSYNNHKLRLMNTAATHPLVNSMSLVSGHNSNIINNNQIKSSNRRGRENHQKYRSQEWPDIPDVAKIEESNPEVLAQKILETGRKIEAKKFQNIQLETKESNNHNTNNNTNDSANISDHHNNSLYKNYISNNQYCYPMNDNQHQQISSNNCIHDSFQYTSSQLHLNQPQCAERLHVNNLTSVKYTHSQCLSSESGNSSQNSSTNINEGEVSSINSNNLSRSLNASPSTGGQTINTTASLSGINSKTGSSRATSGCNNISMHLQKHDLLRASQRKYANNEQGLLVGSTCNLTASVSGSGTCVQESPKVANFEDRLKSIITSALNEDQEQRKAASNNSSISMLQTKHKEFGGISNVATNQSLHLLSGRRNKGISVQTSIAALSQPQSVVGISQQSSNQTIISSSSDVKTKINGVIPTAAHNLMHLNSLTAISPINSTATSKTSSNKSTAISTTYLSKGIPTMAPTLHGSTKIEYINKTNNCCVSNAVAVSDHNTALPKFQQQEQQNHNHYITNKNCNGNINMNKNSDLYKTDTVLIQDQQNRSQRFHQKVYHHTQEPLFVEKGHEIQSYHQDQQQKSFQNQQILPSVAVVVNCQEQQQMPEVRPESGSLLSHRQHTYHSNCKTSGANQSHLRPLYPSPSSMPLEFKTPSLGSNSTGCYGSSCDSIFLDETPSFSAQRDSLKKVEYSNISGLELGTKLGLDPGLIEIAASKTSRHHTHNQKQSQPSKLMSPSSVPSRPNSSSSQPDYTQVSPAKMALRRHLSQERLYQTSTGNGSISNIVNMTPQVASKTIGDLVNGEIERTLEITHQSIINAVVNMSTVGGGVHNERNLYFGEKTSYGGAGVTHAIKTTNEDCDRSRDRLIINSNIARPERPEHFPRHLHQHQETSKRFEELSSSHTSKLSSKRYCQESSILSPTTNGNIERCGSYKYNLTHLAHLANERKPMNLESGNLTLEMTSLEENEVVIDDNNFDSKNEILSKYQESTEQVCSASSVATDVASRTETAITNIKSFAKNTQTDSNFVKNNLCGTVRRQIMTADQFAYYPRSDYQPVTLPKAEIKPCIEAYFQEEQKHTNSNRNHQTRRIFNEDQRSNSMNNSSNQNSYSITGAAGMSGECGFAGGGVGANSKERPLSNNKNVRLNGGNLMVPFEGLAASLQDRMLASQKFRVENEERLRRAAVEAAVSTTTTTETALNDLSNNLINVTDGGNNGICQITKLLPTGSHQTKINNENVYPVNGDIVEQSFSSGDQQFLDNSNNIEQNRVKLEIGIKRKLSETEKKFSVARPAKRAYLIHDGLMESEQLKNVCEVVKQTVRGSSAINAVMDKNNTSNSNSNSNNQNDQEQQEISRNVEGTKGSSTGILPMSYCNSTAEMSASSVTGSQLSKDQLLKNTGINFKTGLSIASNNKNSLLNFTSQPHHYSSHSHHQQELHSIEKINHFNNNYHKHLSSAINLPATSLLSNAVTAVTASNNNSKSVTVGALSQHQTDSSLSSSSLLSTSISLTSTSSSSSAILTLKGNSNTLVTRVADDDDVIADDETLWQDRVSSGFDRLVAFASTELDKTRRSIDTDNVIASASGSSSSISCNTSPDSGITHSSLNSDTSRTFFSTSSTSSLQLDVIPPIGSGGNSLSSCVSSGSGFGANQSQQQSCQSQINLSQSQLHQSAPHCQLPNYHLSRSAAEGDGRREKIVVSPLEDTLSNNESPPSFLDNSLPRTPSPSLVIMMSRSTSASIPTSLSSVQSISGKANFTNSCNNSNTNNKTIDSQDNGHNSYYRHQHYQINNLSKNYTGITSGNHNNNNGIPLKYQRIIKTKTPLEKHYKKKFCERNWGETDNQDDQIQLQNHYYNVKNNVNNSLPNVSDKITTDKKNVDKNFIEKDKDVGYSLETQLKFPVATIVVDEIDEIGKRATEKSQKCQSLISNVLTTSNNVVDSSKNSSDLQQQFSPSANHKSSKFRPKGKDWDWSSGDNLTIGNTASTSMSFSSSTTSATISSVTTAYLATSISVTTSSE